MFMIFHPQDEIWIKKTLARTGKHRRRAKRKEDEQLAKISSHNNTPLPKTKTTHELPHITANENTSSLHWRTVT